MRADDPIGAPAPPGPLFQTLLDAIPYPVCYKDLRGCYLGGTDTCQASVTPGGTQVRQVIVHKAIYPNQDGSPAGIVTTVLDVTEQKLAEAALRQSQDLLTAISRNVADLMAIVTADGVRLYASPSYQTVLGYTPDELDALTTLELIRIATRQIGREVRISVSDNGPGIPEPIRERIFEPFFTTKPVGKGTGQGLAIVHAVVVEKHGGRVTLDSQLGQGSSFHLFLPLDPSGPGQARP